MKKTLMITLLFIMCVCLYCETPREIIGGPEEQLIFPNGLYVNSMIVEGSLAEGKYADETLDILKKYGMNIVWGQSAENFKNNSFFQYLKNREMPSLAVNRGLSYLDYYKENNVFDYTWGDLNPNKKTDRVSVNLISYSQKAVKDIWSFYAGKTVLAGTWGFIQPDFSLPYEFGRGSGGCDPVNIAEYRSDLLGLDEGFPVKFGNKEKIFKFKDYAEYYLGFMPKPSALGIDSWDKYYPVRKAVYDPEGYKLYQISNSNPPEFYADTDNKTKKDYVPDFLLKDMLMQYEALKFLDRTGLAAKNALGFYYPAVRDDLALGCDVYFMSGLVNLPGFFVKYDQSDDFLNAVYTKTDYFSKNINNIKNKKFGVSVEWNWTDPYYKSYIDAYELKTSTGASYFRTGEWPKQPGDPDAALKISDAMANDTAISERVKNILTECNAFKYALNDNGRKIAPDFTTVVSRNIFRPWGAEYRDYLSEMKDGEKSFGPEEILFSNGYVFNTVGFEDAENLSGEMVLWDVKYAPLGKLKALIKRLNDKNLNTAVIPGEALDFVIDETLKPVPCDKYFPEFVREKADVSSAVVKFGEKEFKIYGDYYKFPKGKVAYNGEDGTPLLYKFKIGKSDLYITAFNPGLKENAPLTKQVYDVVLDRSSIYPYWESSDNSSVALYKTNDGWTVRLSGKGENTHSANLFLKPNTEYGVLNYFDGEASLIQTDEKGVLNITGTRADNLIVIKEKKADPSKFMQRRREFAEISDLK